jgi:hypothetical protein
LQISVVLERFPKDERVFAQALHNSANCGAELNSFARLNRFGLLGFR